MARPAHLPQPTTVGDEYLATLVDQVGELIDLVRDRLPAPNPPGGQPETGDPDGEVELSLREPDPPRPPAAGKATRRGPSTRRT